MGTWPTAVASCVVLAVLSGCSGDTGPPHAITTTTSGFPITTSTTTPFDLRLLSLEDLGPGFELLPGDGQPDACEVVIPDATDRLGVKFGSNNALELLGEQLLIYADTASAEAALASAIQASSCPSEDNYANPSPHRVVVDGADDAHAFGFADENGSIGIVLARSDRTVVVMSTRLHNGAASVEPIGAVRAAELAIARLRG